MEVKIIMSRMINVSLFICLSIFVSSVSLLNDTDVYLYHLLNITDTNISERGVLSQVGNLSTVSDRNVSNGDFFYASKTTENIFKTDDSDTERNRDYMKEPLNDLDKFDMFNYKNKSANDLGRTNTETPVHIMASLSLSDSESRTETTIQTRRNNQMNYTVPPGTDTRSNRSNEHFKVDQTDMMTTIKKFLKSNFTAWTSTERTVEKQKSSEFTTLSEEQYQNVTKVITLDKEDTTLNHGQMGTTIHEESLSTATIKYSVHLSPNRAQHRHPMHHLSLVPIEDGPFGSLIWKDKKYLISVLIPIVIGIVGAACIIGMTYTARYCQKYEAKIRDIRSTMIQQTPTSNDQIVLLTDSSDEL
ncbi:unnamed protein product [Mytilus coruscus]|uniref:Uncharacterized protein n=1 Tax=Mytilus coruscus TaxID=42192 RepID=A0A6J8DZY8_MYTCO|nr:unnamed protein product [Mytilus coruscus]